MTKIKNPVTMRDRTVWKNKKPRELSAKDNVHVRVARMIYEARTKAQLTQYQLAKKMGTTQASIACLEDPEYTRHSLSMIDRVATVLKLKLDVHFTEAKPRG